MCRFVTIMAPAAVKLQRLLKLPRFQSPQSSHEAAFRQQYYSKIMAVADMLQSPEEDTLAYPERTAAFLKSLAHCVGKFVRSAQKSLLWQGLSTYSFSCLALFSGLH